MSRGRSENERAGDDKVERDRRGSNGTPAEGRRDADAVGRLVPVLVAMLCAFMVISAVATTVALVNRADISTVEHAIEESNDARRFSRGVICSLEKGVIDAGAKTISGELYGLQPSRERVAAAQRYREEVSAQAAREARSLGILGFPGLSSDGSVDCEKFLRVTESPKLGASPTATPR